MGDDYFNPWTDETHVKRLPFWQIALGFAAAVFAVIAAAWVAAVLILSLERAVS